MSAIVQVAANVLPGTGAVKRVNCVSGGTVTAGMPVYLDAADGKYKPARANSSSTSDVEGIALCAASNGQPLVIQTGGSINLGATLVEGTPYCLSRDVAGEIVPATDIVLGGKVTVLGVSTADDALLLDIRVTAAVGPTPVGTPPVSGEQAIAEGILDGSLGTIVFIGDSILQNMQAAPYLWMTRIGIKGFGFGATWYGAHDSSGVFDSTYPVNDFVDLSEGGGRWAEIVYAGGTSDASSTSTANRMLELARVGPRTAVNEAVEADWDSTEQRWGLGYDWMTTILATGDLKIRIPIYKHADGTTVANEYFVLKNNSTVIATSGFFSTYAATPAYEWIEATIPQGTTTPFTGLNLEVRFKASTASESGKTSYISARGEIYDPLATTGSLVHCMSQGGLDVDDWHTTGTISDVAFGVVSLLDPDVFVIELGINNSSGGSGNNGVAETFAADLALLVTRLRGFCPDAKIIFWGLHGRYTEDPLYGGGGDEPYFTAGMYQAQQATADSAFINSCQLLPNATVLSGPYPYFFQFTNIATGTYIYQGTVVESGGTLYAAKTTHAKIATAPASDGTNWAAVGTYSVFNGRHPKMTDLNPAFYDTLHPHMHGGYLIMQSFVDGLQILKYSSPAALAAGS